MSRGLQLLARYDDLVCPECGTCSVEIVILEDGPPTFQAVAICDRCRVYLNPDRLPTYTELCDLLAAEARHGKCSTCGGSHQRVQTICHRLARQCIYLVSCPACGHRRSAA
ncbi:MAG: hypothetical protein ACE5ID_02930 [Acidobacteriota bacterium]